MRNHYVVTTNVLLNTMQSIGNAVINRWDREPDNPSRPAYRKALRFFS